MSSPSQHGLHTALPPGLHELLLRRFSRQFEEKSRGRGGQVQAVACKLAAGGGPKGLGPRDSNDEEQQDTTSISPTTKRTKIGRAHV